MSTANSQPEEQLSRLFGSYKAEWLKEQIYDLFTEPEYFPELGTPRPCILVGGRGTGKTTVLKLLSYEGQQALITRNAGSESRFIGLYYRVNTNRVTAFRGPELTEEKWVRTFAHYFNLLLCDLIVEYLEWYQVQRGEKLTLGDESYRDVAASLHLQQSTTLRDLATTIHSALIEFEAYINNVGDGNAPRLSLQGAPIDVLAEAVIRLPTFAHKTFFFLLDEYENFLDYQQQVVNTLIKHSGATYTFKIGVKELGIRRRATLNENEQLISPADYVRINIVDKLEGHRFKSFAKSVCNERMARLTLPVSPTGLDIETMLSSLTEEEEAERLGVRVFADRTKEALRQLVDSTYALEIERLSSLQLYFLQTWADGHGTALRDAFAEYIADQPSWQQRFGNYKHSLLFTLRAGKRGIRKYYAGWDVLTQLAACNIRYLLELVDQTLLFHLKTGKELSQPADEKTQTEAAQYVGRKNLSELEGLTVHGAQLTKLLLGLGRVFQTMAANAIGHAPEVNQFHLSDYEPPVGQDVPPDESTEVGRLLTSAVMHLALIRSPGNKLADEAETKDYDYMIHPVFAPFFVFSYRKKRKMSISSAQLLGLVHRPKQTIRAILAQNHRVADDALPEQLELFEGFYHGGP